jgi:predicted DNA-binding transcriptional regulator AlpA
MDDLAADRLLTPRELAARLGVSTRTLEKWRYLGSGPRGIALTPRAIRYPESEVARWLAEKAAGDGTA